MKQIFYNLTCAYDSEPEWHYCQHGVKEK